MKVYVLEKCYDYEGCTAIGAFATKEQAEEAAKQECVKDSDGEEPYRNESYGYWAPSAYSSKSFQVTEFELAGGSSAAHEG